MSAREEILARVRGALERRDAAEHPGPFQGWRPPDADDPSRDPVAAFEALFERSGGEVVHLADEAGAREWLESFAADHDRVAMGATVPEALRPRTTGAPPEEAGLGVSMARGAVAETGSLLLDARDGRRTQILPPVHVVFVRAADVRATLVEALGILHDDLPSAVGLHSGPSKSADIGQILVRGVHGPGRVIAAVVGSGTMPGGERGGGALSR